MRKLDPVRHEEKRRKIVASAGRCFALSGLKGASISDICKEAGISPGHLYHYFKSKDEIIATLSEAWLDLISQRFELVLARERGVAASLASEIGELISAGPNSRSELFFEMLAESKRNAGIATILQAHNQRLRDLLASVVRQGQQQGDVNAKLDPETTAIAMIAMIDGMKALGLRDPGVDRHRVVEMMQGMFAAILEGAAGAPEQKSSE
jgi:TetR/AcrR family transcriptional regulator, repressor for uid operon